MRITRHSPQHVTIHSPALVMWIMALGFLGASALILLVFGAKVTLDCDRSLPPAGACTLETTSLINRRAREIALGDMQQAVIDVSTDSDGDDTYRVVLLTNHGEIPFTGYYSSGYSGKQKLADEINQYLRSGSSTTLSVKTDDRLLMSILAGIFAGAGALMLLFSGTTTIDLDRAAGLLTVRKRSLVSSSSQEYLISEFEGADVESSSSGNYRVVLRLRDGRNVPLTSYYSSGYKGKQKLAAELNEFANSSRYQTAGKTPEGE